MTEPTFLAALDREVTAPLGIAGFRKVGKGVWNRTEGHVLNVIEVQHRVNEALWCVNLGIHFDFLPLPSGAAFDGEHLLACECEIELCLTDSDHLGDQWWPQSRLAHRAIAALLKTHGMAVFGRFASFDELLKILPEDIRAGRMGLLASLTKARACLLLARVNEFLGRPNEAAQFASVGLALTPAVASGPRKAFKDLLQRLARPIL